MTKHERLVIEETKALGYEYRSTGDIHKQEKLPAQVVEIILKYLPDVYADHPGTGDMLCRALKAATEPFDPAVLFDLFEHSQLNPLVKQGIGITLSMTKTIDVDSWIKDQLLHRKCTPDAGAGLLYGMRRSRFPSVKAFMFFLKKIFDPYYSNRMLGFFKRYADDDDLDFLEAYIRSSTNVRRIKEIKALLVKKGR